MKKPAISVIVSTYNRAKSYLPKAIESVLKQTFKDFELIIIDDGSTDKTSEVATSYKDKRIKYHKIKHFGCDPRPKNVGIKRSNGKYIAFLDDDNSYRLDHLQVLYNAMEKNPDVDVVYGDRWVSFEDGSKSKIGSYSDFDYTLLQKSNFIDTSDVLVRREALFMVGGWDESLKKFVDWNLWVRMAKRGFTFKRVPIIITDYIIHEQMKSTLNKEGHYDPETGLFTPTFDVLDCKINAGFLGKLKPPRVAIFTLTKDRLELTKKMAESMSKTAGYPFDWYVVDNGSKDGTVEWLEKQDATVIYYEKNMGIPYASNQIIKEIKKHNYDFIMKVDNDIWFKSSGWLKAMMGVYEVFRPIALSLYIEKLIDNAGGVYRNSYSWLAKEFLGLVVHIGGMTSMMPADVYDEFKWPDSAFLHGGNDVLLSSWLNKNEYLLAYLENYRAEHIDSTLGQQKKYPEYFKLREKETRTRTSDHLKTGKLVGVKKQ